MTVVTSRFAYEAAFQYARGCYQRDVLTGRARLSGADLKGKAAYYGVHYARSRRNLLKRIEQAGIPVGEILVGRRRTLVIGPMTHAVAVANS